MRVSHARGIGGHAYPSSARDDAFRTWQQRLFPLLAAMVLGTASGIGMPHHAAAASAPPYFLSNYVTSLNYSNWNAYGCAQAEYAASQQVSSISLVLDFGTPYDQNGQYGTILLDSGGIFAQWDSGGASGIRYLVANFMAGYWNCRSTGYGNAPTMLLYIGDNNIYSNINYNTNTNAAWMGEVVSAVDSWLGNAGWTGVEYAEAASDTETGWAAYSPYTINYLSTVAANDGGNPIYDFGDAGGCQQNGPYNPNFTCNGGWLESQVLDISWGETWAWPLPEIYNEAGANASEWYWISKGSIATYGYPVTFNASLTQYTACQQKGGCNGTDNSPSAGWTQLYDALWNDSSTQSGDAMTWSDDIRYLG